MKPLWGDLRPLLAFLALLSLLINVMYLVPSLFTLQVFDRVLTSNSPETLVVLLAGTGVALLILLVLDYVRSRLQHLVGTLVDERLSPPVVNAIVARAARGQGAGSDGVRDVAALRNVFSSGPLIALFDTPWAVVYLLVIWGFHPTLGIGAAGAAVLMLLLAWLNDRITRHALESVQKEGRRSSQFVESSLRNAEVLQAMGMTGSLLQRWRTFQDRLTAAHTSASRTGSVFSSVTKMVRQAVQIFMMSLGAYLVLDQQGSAGIMIATTILLGRATQPIEQLVGSWRLLTDARAAYRRLRDLSSEFPTAEEPRVEMPRPEGRLVVENVSYRARGSETNILANIAFSLESGEALAIVGPSAAGKSTLARLLIGVWAPTTGSVCLDGADVRNWPRPLLGPWIGYLPQDIELFDGSVGENIARLGPIDSAAVGAAARRAHAHELILGLPQGYETPAGELGMRLSPGQRQRVALARALYGDPRLVVLDEPNSNLDGAGEMALAEALRGLHEDGVTSIVITHRPSLIAHVDKVLVLAAGRIQQFGPAAEVMKAPSARTALAVGAKGR